MSPTKGTMTRSGMHVVRASEEQVSPPYRHIFRHVA